MRLGWLEDGVHRGAVNMAIDRALLRDLEEGGRRSPFLRVYGWDPAAISLGFHQDEAELDPQAIAARGLDVVRRPTGGAAVLHAEEITYAVVAPLDLPGTGRTVDSIYDGVACCLVDALRALGVAAERGGGGRPEGFACFAALGGHEVGVGGRKLLGSALRRGRRSFLMHGSLLRGPAHLDLADCFRDPPSGQDRATLARHTTDLTQLGRGAISPEAFGAELSARLGSRWALPVERRDRLPIPTPGAA